MPELPEVTTIVKGLNEKVQGLTIKDVWTDWEKIVKSPSFSVFKKEVTGKKITGAERIGKNILLYLSGDKTILFHMKMTGHFLYGKWIEKKSDGKISWKPEKENSPLSDPLNRFLHLIFYLSNGNQFALSDMRKFAKVVLLTKGKEFESKDLKNIGPDPLNKKINFKKFKEIIYRKKDWRIKQLLMNQEIISGIGNIYSDEILWDSGIHPEEKLKNIPDEKLEKLFNSAKKILKNSIALGGDSMSDYRKINGEKGEYQKHHKAYRMTGHPCPKKDGGKIIRIKVGGRSAHFCETHQKLSSSK